MSQFFASGAHSIEASASLTTLKPLTLKEMGIPDHLTCVLKNLYADQEATHTTQCQKNKQPNQKEGKRPKQTTL